jgi:hypothetical protein
MSTARCRLRPSTSGGRSRGTIFFAAREAACGPSRLPRSPGAAAALWGAPAAPGPRYPRPAGNAPRAARRGWRGERKGPFPAYRSRMPQTMGRSPRKGRRAPLTLQRAQWGVGRVRAASGRIGKSANFNDFNVYGRSFEPSRFCGTGPPSGPDVCTSRPSPRLKRRR